MYKYRPTPSCLPLSTNCRAGLRRSCRRRWTRCWCSWPTPSTHLLRARHAAAAGGDAAGGAGGAAVSSPFPPLGQLGPCGGAWATAREGQLAGYRTWRPWHGGLMAACSCSIHGRIRAAMTWPRPVVAGSAGFVPASAGRVGQDDVLRTALTGGRLICRGARARVCVRGGAEDGARCVSRPPRLEPAQLGAAPPRRSAMRGR